MRESKLEGQAAETGGVMRRAVSEAEEAGGSCGVHLPGAASPARTAAPWPLGPLGLALRAADAAAAGVGVPRVAVLGLARSGIGAGRLLQARGCRVDLCDLRAPEPGAEAVEDLVRRGGRLRIGPHDPAWLESYDLLVKSPGVPADIPFFAEAKRQGVPVISELELGFLAARGPVLAITGTNGKSTTTAWAGDMMARSGRRALVVGNIGRALCDGVLEDAEAVFVTEVSSFQLENIVTFRPKVACLLNLTPDHLDRHGSFDAYRKAKMRIFSRQGEEDLALLGPEEDLVRAARPHVRARLARFLLEDRGEEGSFVREDALWLRQGGREVRLLWRSGLSQPGPHNLENALAAAAACAALGADADAITASLRLFPGLPHRLEKVGTIRGVPFVNDSKATNTESLAVALRSFSEPVILIAGGRDKGQDFAPLRPLVERQTALLILIGEAAELLERSWAGVPSLRAATLEEAVEAALRRARPGQTVLLSPACASFDMFRNYEDRGDQFRELVRSKGEAAC